MGDIKNFPIKQAFKKVESTREVFIDGIGYQADWREQKAAEYPDDVRNANSAKKLRQLAHQLKKLPPSDALWVRYAGVWRQDGGDVGRPMEYENEVLRTYGFHNDASQSGINADEAVRFLREHVHELERMFTETRADE